MFLNFLATDPFFFDELERHAAKTLEACRALAVAASGGSSETAAREISHLEHECDQITHKVVSRLHTTLITPLDRNEIYRLITKLDDVVDSVEAAAERFALFELYGQKEVAAMTAVLLQSASRMGEAVSGLRDLRKGQTILDACLEIGRLEKAADGLLRAALSRLFREERDAVAIMKWKELYELIEIATDRCEDVANVVEGVVLENA